VAEFAGAALGAGRPCLIIATPEHRFAIVRQLGEYGIDVARAVDEGRFVVLDAAETLREFLVEGWPDEASFRLVVERVLVPMLRTAKKKGQRVAVFGEMVALMVASGSVDGAIHIEQMWNEMGKRYAFSLLCGYSMRSFSRPEDESTFRRICLEHDDVRPCESYELAADAEKLLIISELQQKALMLEAVAKENARLLDEATLELNRRENVEEALRKSEEFSRSVVESSADCIKVLDLEGRILYISAHCMKMLGIAEADAVLAKPWVGLWSEADQGKAAEAVSVAREGGVGHFEGLLTVGGKTTWWDVKLAPMFNREGAIGGLTVVSRETTDLKLAQAALMQAEKLAATGRLAATVAHEINNPLEAVTNSVYLAKTTPGLPADVYELLETADHELVRVGHMAQQTLGFYRDAANPQRVNLAELTRQVASLYERKLKYKNLTLTPRVDGELSLFIRKGEMKQVFSNLLANAIDAALPQGNIAIRAHAATNWRTGEKGVRILVADDGEGMSRETQEKAFAAFFTTKKDIGTGIGLWVTKNILEKQGGTIRCRSTQGRGAVMSLFLPGGAE